MKDLQILAYHRILPQKTAQSRGVLAVTVDNFNRQLDFFLQRGWRCLTLAELYSGYLAAGEDPGKVLVLTFDDGYQDNYLYAFPALKHLGLRATVFVTTDFIGKDLDLYFASRTRQYAPEKIDLSLSGDEIKEMNEYGIEFGSHTHTHPHLTALSPDQMLHELSYSRSVLENLISKEVVSVCYPFGDVNRQVIETARKAGYSVGVVTPPRPGIPRSIYTLRRTGVYLNDSPLKLQLKSTRLFSQLRESRLWKLRGKS